MPRTPQYLYLYSSLKVEASEAEVGSGKTVTAKVCATREGDPAAIGTATASATASSGMYTIQIARSALQSSLGSMVGQRVFVHVDDGAAWHDVWEYQVTDVDPDLLPDLLG